MLPIGTPGPSRSTAQIILRNGDVLADGLVVANIEDASLGTDGASALAIRIADSGNRTAIVTRAADGTFAVALDPRTTSADVDTTTITRLRIGPTGEMVFQTGSGLDSDRLYLLASGVLTTIAGAAPGPVAPAFRILGNVRIGEGGKVAFVGGGGACEVVVGDGEPRVTCDNALYAADASAVAPIEDPTFDLTRQRPTAIRVESDPTGAIWFSLPRRGDAPIVVRYSGGEATPVLTGEQELAGAGAVNSVEAVAANAGGEVLLEASLRVLENDRRPQVLGILRDDGFAAFAKEGTELGGSNVATLRGIGLDASGQALFEARLGSADAPADQVSSIWLGNENGLQLIAREGDKLAGDDSIILTILGSRLDANGDVALITELGTNAGGVVQRQEVRASVWRANGQVVTVASTRHTAQFGDLSSLQLVGYDDAGTLLLIGTRGRSSDRVLLLGRSDQSAD